MGVLFSLIYIGLVVTAMIATQKASQLTKFRGTKLVRPDYQYNKSVIHDRNLQLILIVHAFTDFDSR